MPQLARRLRTGDAVFIGLGSMIGAGVFAAFTPAAQAAGAGLLVGLVVAAIVAACNALASAQLAATYPVSGGTYVYGREVLGPWWGYLAGFTFVIGKIASCAAMALVFASYAAPAGWERPLAIAAVVLLGGVNYLGVTRTALVARVLVVLVLAALAVAVAGAASSGLPSLDGISGDLLSLGPYGVLQSAGLLFFAFAGYARIATMGEEVVDAPRTIPRAIVIALSVTVLLYLVVGLALLGSLGADGLAASAAPVRDAAVAGGWLWAAPVVTVGAALASLGALLGLIAGVSRTVLAMARERDLPGWLAAVHPRFAIPHRAEVVVSIIVIALVATLDVRSAIGFSSFGVLLYYFVANASALRQGAPIRRYPRGLFVLGAMGCAVLVATLPWPSIVGGLVVIAVGVGYRAVRVRVRG